MRYFQLQVFHIIGIWEAEVSGGPGSQQELIAVAFRNLNTREMMQWKATLSLRQREAHASWA